MKTNKRGVSGVITSVLMILLVIAAIGILWFVIQNFISGSTDQIPNTADCLELNLDIVDATATPTTLSVAVKRVSGDAEIADLRFIVNGTATPMTGAIPTVGETKTYTATTTVDFTGEDVEVAAVIGDKQCEVASTFTIA